MRRAIEDCSSPSGLAALWTQHGSLLAPLRAVAELTTERGDHYADLLQAICSKRLQELQRAHSAAVVSLPRRWRDKAHLRQGGKPCLICGRSPAQAHHLKFVEPRGLGLRPSDDLAVPLCRLHHRSLHYQGDEQSWWQRHQVDPLAEAERLWQARRGRTERPADSSAVPDGTAARAETAAEEPAARFEAHVSSHAAAAGSDTPPEQPHPHDPALDNGAIHPVSLAKL